MVAVKEEDVEERMPAQPAAPASLWYWVFTNDNQVCYVLVLAVSMSDMKLDTPTNADLSLNRVVGAKVMQLSDPPTCDEDYVGIAQAIAAGNYPVPGFTDELKSKIASKTTKLATYLIQKLEAKRQDGNCWKRACLLRCATASSQDLQVKKIKHLVKKDGSKTGLELLVQATATALIACDVQPIIKTLLSDTKAHVQIDVEERERSGIVLAEHIMEVLQYRATGGSSDYTACDWYVKPIIHKRPSCSGAAAPSPSPKAARTPRQSAPGTLDSRLSPRMTTPVATQAASDSLEHVELGRLIDERQVVVRPSTPPSSLPRDEEQAVPDMKEVMEAYQGVKTDLDKITHTLRRYSVGTKGYVLVGRPCSSAHLTYSVAVSHGLQRLLTPDGVEVKKVEIEGLWDAVCIHLHFESPPQSQLWFQRVSGLLFHPACPVTFKVLVNAQDSARFGSTVADQATRRQFCFKVASDLFPEHVEFLDEGTSYTRITYGKHGDTSELEPVFQELCHTFVKAGLDVLW